MVATECCEDLADCPALNQNRENGNGRTVRNILEVGYRQMAYRVLHTFGPELFDVTESACACSYYFSKQVKDTSICFG